MIAQLGGVRATIFASLFLISSIAFGWSHLTHKAYKASVAVAEAKAQRVARAKEEGWRKGIDSAVRELIKKRNLREKELENDIAELRGRKPTLVVRDRLTCPSQASHDSPGAGGDGERGLSTDDAEFLLRVGARANAVRDKYNTCLRILKEERGINVE